jgi:hypothetical protein
MHAYQLFPSGAWCVQTMLGAQLVTQTYYGYSKRESLAAFRAYLKTLKD